MSCMTLAAFLSAWRCGTNAAYLCPRRCACYLPASSAATITPFHGMHHKHLIYEDELRVKKRKTSERQANQALLFGSSCMPRLQKLRL